MTAMLPAHLTESLNNLGAAARDLAAETRAERLAQRRRDRLVVALLALVALLVASLVMLALVNRRTNTQNRQIIQQIGDCTTAGGTCYEDGQRRTGDAIAELVRAQLLVEACAQVPANDTAAELERCVAAGRR